MRVIGVRVFGGPEMLESIDLPEPHAGAGQLRIRVEAAAVNPADTMLRSGVFAKAAAPPEPVVPGMDVSGVIDEIGEGTQTTMQMGDAVMAIVIPRRSHGGYSEYVVVPAGSVARRPAGASAAEAATLPMNGLTARLALDRFALPAGATLAITGAAGALGGYLVQLGKAEGLRVIADASANDEALVRSLGADQVVARGDGVAERIRAVVPDGVDALFDSALQGGPTFAAVRDGGQYAAGRTYAGPTERDITIHNVLVMHYAEEHGKLDELRRQAEEGVLHLRVARVLPATEAPEAHRLLAAGGMRGRLVLQF